MGQIWRALPDTMWQGPDEQDGMPMSPEPRKQSCSKLVWISHSEGRRVANLLLSELRRSFLIIIRACNGQHTRHRQPGDLSSLTGQQWLHQHHCLPTCLYSLDIFPIDKRAKDAEDLHVPQAWLYTRYFTDDGHMLTMTGRHVRTSEQTMICR